MSEDDMATKLTVHEAVCAERWKQANDRLGRIEIIAQRLYVRAQHQRPRPAGHLVGIFAIEAQSSVPSSSSKP
jgi:hypothetical protein